jgi:hypothetical protein
LSQPELDKVELIVKQYCLGLVTLDDVVLELWGGQDSSNWVMFFAFLYLLQYYTKGAFTVPSFLDPNLGNTKFESVDKYIRVEFQQTTTHIHHAPEFGISLPDNFNMAYYRNLDRSGKIAYATKMLPRSTIISYQNEIAKGLTPVFNPNTYSRDGIAGQQKVPTQLIIEKPRDPYPLPGQQIRTSVPSGKKDIMLGIISEDNLHISSFPITQARLDRLEAENYWVLKNQNIQ